MKTMLLSVVGGVLGCAVACALFPDANATDINSFEGCVARTYVVRGETSKVFDCN